MKRFIFILFVLFAFLINSGWAQEKCLVLGAVSHDRLSLIANQVSVHLHKSGICNHAKFGPEKRITSLLLNKKIDGELLRVPAYGKKVSHVAIKVETPVLKANGLLVVQNINHNSLYSLQGNPVGIIRGQQWASQAVEYMNNVIEVSDYLQLPEMMKVNRIAGFLIDDITWKTMLANYPEFHTFFIEDLSAHIWLLKEHASRVPAISEALKNLDVNTITK